MATERIDPRFADLDAWPSTEMVRALFEGQMAAVAAVQPALPVIAAAVDAMALRLGGSGRLVYVGAGTSGRIGVQDGSELPPTFGWPPERVAFIIAGGEAALTRSVEGAEDNADDGRAQIDRLVVAAADVVIGLAASGATPFTLAAVREARRRGALTIGIANNEGAPLLSSVEHAVLIETGAEVIAGSTRMKAGTAQKIVLNLLSTGVMVRLGRVYRGIMVDMAPSNEKLRRRAAAIVAHLAGCSEAAGRAAFADAGGDLKRAILMAHGHDRAKADARLAAAAGNLRVALASD